MEMSISIVNGLNTLTDSVIPVENIGWVCSFVRSFVGRCVCLSVTDRSFTGNIGLLSRTLVFNPVGHVEKAATETN